MNQFRKDVRRFRRKISAKERKKEMKVRVVSVIMFESCNECVNPFKLKHCFKTRIFSELSSEDECLNIPAKRKRREETEGKITFIS